MSSVWRRRPWLASPTDTIARIVAAGCGILPVVVRNSRGGRLSRRGPMRPSSGPATGNGLLISPGRASRVTRGVGTA